MLISFEATHLHAMVTTMLCRSDLHNAALLIVVPTPSLFIWWHLQECRGLQSTVAAEEGSNTSCTLTYTHPLLLLNVLVFFNMSVLFWGISLLQRSTWLIDPYWTLLPVLIACFYRTHPAASHTSRAVIAEALLLVWSLRLTHSYFRREGWRVGAREDWRYAKLRQEWGRHWWWGQLLLVHLLQQAMLVGLTLPLYCLHFGLRPKGGVLLHLSGDDSHTPLGALDALAAVACLIGICVAGVADRQLHDFVAAKGCLEGRGPLVLDTGLWRYSRHPNYFGEQLWWWGLAAFAAAAGRPWALVGPAFNSACMVPVTKLTEQRMLQRPERTEAYAAYQASTCVLVPWWPRGLSTPRKQL